MRAQAFIVTTKIGNNARSHVWDAHAPLSLGHPFRWVVERTQDGVRVRNVATATGEIQSDAVREITHSMIRKGAAVDLPRGTDRDLPDSLKMTFEIRPVARIKAPFESLSDTGELQAYTCLGAWVLRTEAVGSSFTGRLTDGEAFTLVKSGSEFKLKLSTGAVIGNDSGASQAQAGEAFALSREELLATTVSVGAMLWRFGAVQATAFQDAPRRAQDFDSVSFRQAGGAALALFALLMAAALFWPKPQPSEELIPEQFTKIVMAPPTQAPQASSSESRAQGNDQRVQKATEAKVVQAFRAKALQNAVSGLLKGGMTRLLAQSDIVAGPNAHATANQMFGKKSDALKPTATNTGLTDSPNVKVASLGGDGVGTGGSGVGYRKGGSAGVQGQGSNFVNMDTFASTVEEGLTKDEVGEVIHKHLSEVRYCYESAMIRTPDIEGKLIISFTIGGPGSVKTADVKSSTLPDPRLDDCILRRLMTWKFPNTRGGVDVAVSYPFIFKTLGR